MLIAHRIRFMNYKMVEIQRTDIIPMVNYAWKRSFERVETNKKAISYRGWFPFNRNVLLHPDLRNTMTEKQITDEINFRDDLIQQQHDSTRNAHNDIPPLNWQNNYARSFLAHVVRDVDQMTAREQLEKDKEMGVREKKSMDQMSKISSANMIKYAGQYDLNSTILEVVQKKFDESKKKKNDKMMKHKQHYDKICADADAVLKKDKLTWTIKDYQMVLKPLKQRSDGKMPSNLDALKTAYSEWSHRERKNNDGELLNDDENLMAMEL